MTRYFLFILAFFAYHLLCSQSGKINQLLIQLASDGGDSSRVIHLNQLCQAYRVVGDYNASLAYGKQALQLARELSYKTGMANAYCNIANTFCMRSNYPEAIKNNMACMQLRIELGDKKGIAETHHNLGAIYDKQGEYALALQSYTASLAIDDEIEDWRNAIITCNNIGVIHERRGDYSMAISSYFLALKKVNGTSIHDMESNFNVHQNIGNVYLHQGKYEEALKQYLASLDFEKKRGNKQGIADSYNNLGVVYCSLGKYHLALRNHYSSLELKEKIGDKQGMAVSLINTANVYKGQKLYTKALDLQYQALSVYKAIGDKHGICVSYVLLGGTQSLLNKPDDAERFLNNAMTLNTEMQNIELNMEIYRAFATLNNILSGRRGQSLKNKEAKMMKAIGYYKLWLSSLENTTDKGKLTGSSVDLESVQSE